MQHVIICSASVFLTLCAVGQAGEQQRSPLVYYSVRGDQSMTWKPSGLNETIPGRISVPYPTLQNLAIEWTIEGDDNLNCEVTVRYRASGELTWRNALPLRRVPAMVYDAGGGRQLFRWANKLSGSILDLEPGTTYDIALTLRDPDGGEAQQTLQAHTRPAPADMPGAPIIRVTPATLRDAAARANPGDVFLLAPGNYGYFAAERDGLPGKPIVFRADPFDVRQRNLEPERAHQGNRQFALFNGVSLQHRKYVHLEGVLSRNTIDIFNAEHCVVRRCIVHAAFGILSSQQGLKNWLPEVYGRLQPPPNENLYYETDTPRTLIPPHAKNCLISDNIIIGVTPWRQISIGAKGKNLGEGIQVSGPGNVICYNKVIGFRDCISLMEGRYAEEQACVDIYNNDVYNGADDGIEADYIFHNCRIMRNRLTNCMRGIAAAPVLGGPAYCVRNVLYNTLVTWQFGRIGSGYVALHNTSVKRGTAIGVEPHLHSWQRNNLFVGGGAQAEAVYTRGEVMPHIDLDFNGYGVEGAPFKGTLAGKAFDSQPSLRANTMEQHGVQVELNVFASRPTMPSSLFPELPPPNLQLRPGSSAVDAGVVLPNVNEAFTGDAPDLGAYELGFPIPHYGPRGPVVDQGG